MDKETAVNKAFEIIAIGGDAKGQAYEALEAAQAGNFTRADELMAASEEAMVQAHNIQTEMIVLTARGEEIPIDMLFIHGQDHLMCGIEAQSLIKYLIALNKRVADLEAKLEER